jgi:hypothetical protein
MDDSFLIIESPPDAYIDDLGCDFKHPDAARGSTHTGKLPSKNPFNAIRDILIAPRDPSGTYVPKGPTHTGAFPGHSGEKFSYLIRKMRIYGRSQRADSRGHLRSKILVTFSEKRPQIRADLP